MRKIYVALMVIACVALQPVQLVVAEGDVSREDAPEPVGPVRDIPDVDLMAEQQGWSLAQAQAHVLAAEVSGEIAEQIATERPDVFVHSALSRDPFGNPTIYIKGQPDHFIRTLIESASVPIDVVADQPYSAIEIEARQMALEASLRENGIHGWSVGTDRKTGVLELWLGSESMKSIDEVLKILPESHRSDLNIQLVGSITRSRENASFGGMRTFLPNGDPWCMTSWSVENISTGETGVASANHCLNHDGFKHPGYSTHAITFKNGEEGTWGDVAWWTTPKPEPPQFYAEPGGVIRDVLSFEALSQLQENEVVCIFSRVQGLRRCDAQIMDVSRSCEEGSPNYVGHMVWMDSGVTEGGDSGGGWSLNTRAYGTHSGKCIVGFPGSQIGYSIWSPVALHDTAVNIEVIVGP